MIYRQALPAYNLQESIAFYKSLGAKLGRHNDRAAILSFFGIQLVLHKVSEKPPVPLAPYPYHQGPILPTKQEFDDVVITASLSWYLSPYFMFLSLAGILKSISYAIGIKLYQKYGYWQIFPHIHLGTEIGEALTGALFYFVLTMCYLLI